MRRSRLVRLTAGDPEAPHRSATSPASSGLCRFWLLLAGEVERHVVTLLAGLPVALEHRAWKVRSGPLFFRPFSYHQFKAPGWIQPGRERAP